eukprot:1397456-Rhodomonas_salina.5
MTGFIIFLWPSSTEQIAIGVLVTTTAMVYVMRAMPYANHHIGSLQAAMLAAQVQPRLFSPKESPWCCVGSKGCGTGRSIKSERESCGTGDRRFW